MLLLAADGPGEGKRRRTIERRDSVGAVSESCATPAVAHRAGIFRRLRRWRERLEQQLAPLDGQSNCGLRSPRARSRSRATSSGRMKGAGASSARASSSSRVSGGISTPIGRSRRCALTPGGELALGVFAAIAPGVDARREDARRAVHVHRDPLGAVGDLLESRALATLQLVADDSLRRPPREAGRGDLRYRARTRAIAPLALDRRRFVQHRRRRGRRGSCQEKQRERPTQAGDTAGWTLQIRRRARTPNAHSHFVAPFPARGNGSGCSARRELQNRVRDGPSIHAPARKQCVPNPLTSDLPGRAGSPRLAGEE